MNIEARHYDERYTRKAPYNHSESRTLFRYTLTTAEPATATLQVTLDGTPDDVAFRLVVLRDGEELAHEESQRCFLPHLMLSPGEKNAPVVYVIEGTLERSYPGAMEKQRQDRVMAQYAEDLETQEGLVRAHVLGIEAQLERGETLEELAGYCPVETPAAPQGGPLAAPVPAPTVVQLKAPADLLRALEDSVTAQAACHNDFGMGFTLTLNASSSRLDLKEDLSVAQQQGASKAAWALRDAPELPPNTKVPKPVKGQPVVDESAVRAAKARDARRRFLANPGGSFVPYQGRDGTVHLDATTAPGGAPFIAPAEETPWDEMKELESGDDGKGAHGGSGQETPDGGVGPAPKPAIPKAPPRPTSPQKAAQRNKAMAHIQELYDLQKGGRKEVFESLANRLYEEYELARPQTVDPEEDKRGSRRRK